MTVKIAKAQTALLLFVPAAAAFLPDRPHSFRVLGLAVGVWLLALLGLVVRRAPLPASRAGRAALAGLALFAFLTAISLSWAGVLEPAASATVLALLYLGFLLASVPALRGRVAARAVEPVLVLTAFAATLWGLSERVLPRTFNYVNPRVAMGRLADPLGYWNAMGLLCGLGLILAARIAGDVERSRTSRALCAACTPILSAGLWLAFSRGALAASAAGLVGLIALVATRAQVKAILLSLFGAAVAIVSAESLRHVATTQYELDDRAREGRIFGLILLATALAVGLIQSWLAGRSENPDSGTLGRTPVRVAALITVLLAAAPFVSVIAGQAQSTRGTAGSGADAARLASSESNRTDYWRAQLGEFRANPIIGSGAGSFETTWIRERGALEPARNAHSLVVETAGDLGLVGLAALLLLIGGIAACVRSAWRADRRLIAGPAAGLIAFASHTAIDWDWQVPGVTLFALLLSAVAIASIDRPAERRATAQRVGVGLVAVVVIALLGWSLRGVELERRGGRIVDSASLLGWTENRYSRAKTELEAAAVLNPWPGPRIILAKAAWASGHDSDAVAQARSLTESNPDSWLAWGLLAKVVRPQDPALARAALERAHQLRPKPPAVTR